jgi:hypothetical protein
MLVAVARTNIMTWQFEPHEPTTFETNFRFSLPESDCSVDAGTITLNLPSEVRIIAPDLLPCRPIPDPTKPLLVHLKVERNGKTASLPRELILKLGNVSSHVAIDNGVFAVPPEFWRAEKATIRISAKFERDEINAFVYAGDFGMESWKIILADWRFPKENRRFTNIWNARKTCVIEFQSPYYEGTGLVENACRSKNKK